MLDSRMADIATARVKRRYIDGRWGQVHLAEANPDAGNIPILCLHATAYSSISLLPLVRALGRVGRHVLALDTPGYGGSDAPPGPVTIEDHADALIEALDGLGLRTPVDIFGYHTGASIGAEAAVRAPTRVRSLAMIGVPLFDGPDRDAWRERLVVRHRLGDRLDQFDERWDYLVAGRAAGLSLERGFVNFIDELRAWPNGWWAHDALFRHDLAATLRSVAQPVLVINPDSSLADASRAAAALLSDGVLVERPAMRGAIFERHADDIATLLGDFLTEPARAPS